MSGRIAVKFAYDGTKFMGSQRQPRAHTVESELLAALKKIGAISSVGENRFRVASRTDRGVSALGNVFAIDTDFRRQELLRAVNAVCRNVYCIALAEVPDNFSPRRARGRWYRYYLPYRGHDLSLMTMGAHEFEGEHEFRLFCKPDGKVTTRSLNSVKVERIGDMVVIDLQAREFMRNMVRRIVSVLDQAGQGKMTLEEIRIALRGEGRSMGPAEPEGLFLMDVDHGLEMSGGSFGPMMERVRREKDQAWLRWQFNDLLLKNTDMDVKRLGK